MANKRDTLVLFDVGGVLLSLNFQNFYDRASALSGSVTPGEFKDRYVSSRIDFLACRGRISRSENVRMLRKLIGPGETVPDDLIESAVESAWLGPVRGTVELKRRVYEAGYTVGILSNITELALAQISSRHPEIFETFDGRSPRLFSCRLGTMKPEPEVYRLSGGYEKVIFIDDRKSYLEVPVRLRGWKGIWFTPCIDETESLRAVHGGGVRASVQTEGIRQADSVHELTSHLGEYGVEVP